MKFRTVKATTHGVCAATIEQHGADSPQAVRAICELLAAAVILPDYDVTQWDEQGSEAVYSAYMAYRQWEQDELYAREDPLGNYLREAMPKRNSSSPLLLQPGVGIPTN